MSFLRSGGNRGIKKLGAVFAASLVFSVLSVVGAGSASAFGVPECQYNAATNEVTVNPTGGDDFEVYVTTTASGAGNQVRVHDSGGTSYDCGSATAGNTDIVTVLGDNTGDNTVEIENGGSDTFATGGNCEGCGGRITSIPGAGGGAVGVWCCDSFADGTQFNIDLGENLGDVDSFWYQGRPNADDVQLAASDTGQLLGTINGGNFEVSGLDQVPGFGAPDNGISLNDGDDNYNGGASTTRLYVFGGEGWDYVRPNLGAEVIYGGEPDDSAQTGELSGFNDGERGDTLDWDRGTANAVSSSLAEDSSPTITFDADDGERCTDDVTFFGVAGNICEGDDVQGFRIIISGAGNDYLEDDENQNHAELFAPGLGDDTVFARDNGEDTIAFPAPCTGPVTIDSANGVATGCGTDTWPNGIGNVAGSPANEAGFNFTNGTITGGDTLDFSGEAGPIEVDLEGDLDGSSTIFNGVLEAHHMPGWQDSWVPYVEPVENVVGSPDDDEIFGTEYRNVLDGGAGNDEIAGDDANDVLIGGAGNDIFTGGRGADAVYFGRAANGVVVDLSLGFATGEGDDSFSPWADFIDADVELVFGSQFNDDITGGLTGFGSGLNFRFVGKAGNDNLTGADSNDTLLGGRGDDVMRGGSGLDTLKGAQGEDWGFGGGGRDFCARSTEHKRSC